MSREILQDIIDNFSPDKFLRFFREKHRYFSPRQESFSQYNDTSFTEGMKFGEIKFSESEKLIACAFKSIQPLSERSSRKAQYDKGKKILKDTQSDASIFIFYDHKGNFRFSLIYPEAVGNRRQWSNFRRFTYFVSSELTNRTFLTRVGDGDFSSLDKIKDAFSVEKVAKEFYEQYRKLFEALIADLNKNRVFQMVASKNQINTPNFAKKTLGQIVFLYFLQKKGWLGVPQNKPWGEGDKNFISNLYKQAVKKSENFYNDYLEILFYDTLNNAVREGADPSFSKYFNCRIPFLNGGLFEPEYDWHGTKIYLENSVFKNIFEVFDRYNFTVEEESPDDKEVAVDPEMLGKVFENLLEENLRKGKGTYYTPREIVHYMCRESLVNYLVSQSGFKEDGIRSLILNHESGFSSDEVQALGRLLADIKACDPACGSGAFLVGMLNEIVNARLVLNPAGSEYGLKKETIQNCIYGVDIDPGAVEIAKLRLWLSLVVDYELADIEPLPNLDYKIMCGNSLLEELIVGDESIELFDPEVLEKDKPKRKTSDKLVQMDFLKQDAEEYLRILRKLHGQYFHETNTEQKKIVRGRIEKIEIDFIQSSINKRVKELDERIRNLNMQKPEDRKKNTALMKRKLEYLAIPNDIRRSKVRPYFLWHLNFFEVFQEKGGFDVVIANPPYVGIEGMSWDTRKCYEGIFQTATGRFDLYSLFIEKAMQIKSYFGAFAFIVPGKFLNNKQFVTARKIVCKNHGVTVVKIDNKVFEAAQVDSVIVENYLPAEASNPKYKTFRFTEQKLEPIAEAEIDIILQDEEVIFRLEINTHLDKLISKIKKDTLKVKEIGEVKDGIIAGAIKGILFLDKKLDKDSKRLYFGKHLSRYRLVDTDVWINYKPDEMMEEELKITKPKGPGLRMRDPKIFNREKILSRFVAKEIIATYDDENKYYEHTLHSTYITNERFKTKYILGLLNATLLKFYYQKTNSQGGNIFPQIRISSIENLPIKLTDPKTQEKLENLVNNILAIAKDDDYLQNLAGQGKVKEYERQIDQMVYKIYGLTEEEIKIVENSVK